MGMFEWSVVVAVVALGLMSLMGWLWMGVPVDPIADTRVRIGCGI